MKNYRKGIVQILFCFASTVLYSYGDKFNTEFSEINMEEKQSSFPINDKKKWDCFASGSFIYWLTYEDGLDLAVYYSDDPGFTDINKFLLTDFKYKPGLKVGLELNNNSDHWSFNADYIWLRGNIKTLHHVPPSGAGYTVDVRSFWRVSFLTDLREVHSEWNFSSHILDGSIGRKFFDNDVLTFKLFGGLRSYWIDQSHDVRYIEEDGDLFPSYYKSDSWAVGIRSGIHMNWIVIDRFRLLGNIAGSVAYQHFKIHSDEWWNHFSELNRSFTVKRSNITPNIDLAAGLGWRGYFSSERSDRKVLIDLCFLYEFLYFWNQNQMIELNNAVSFRNPDVYGNLAFHGLTIKMEIGF